MTDTATSKDKDDYLDATMIMREIRSRNTVLKLSFFTTGIKQICLSCLFLLAYLQNTVEPRLFGLVGTRRNSPDNRKYEY